VEVDAIVRARDLPVPDQPLILAKELALARDHVLQEQFRFWSAPRKTPDFFNVVIVVKNIRENDAFQAV
jgi:hypothetical protein